MGNMESNKQAFLTRLSKLVRGAKIFDSLLLARRRRLVVAAEKAMKNKSFIFNGIQLPYSYFVYNSTYGSERAIEISIGKWFLEQYDDVLEIGNVMNHYYPIRHDVVDKYEKVDGVRNEDVVDIKDAHKNILSISTLEHVGFDENGDHKKFYQAIEIVKGLFTENLLITVPWGYNPSVDEFLRGNHGGLDLTFYYRDGREWKVGNFETIEPMTYGSKYSCANAIAVLQMKK